MIRLGHIVYSNCFPVHALLLDCTPPPGIVVVPGVPSELNERLARGEIDVAPCSSIEYARHVQDYAVLPGHAIASDGAVGSILLESTVPPEALSGCDVLVPTASATSVVLLRILLERRFGVRTKLRWFDQSLPDDPLASGAAAVLWIGDVALRRCMPRERRVLDLGAAWKQWTGLPFTFAVWQARRDVDAHALARLQQVLLESRAYFSAHTEALAQRHATGFGMEPAALVRYWRSLRYSLDDDALRGLMHFFRLAAELGEAEPVSALRWTVA